MNSFSDKGLKLLGDGASCGVQGGGSESAVHGGQDHTGAALIWVQAEAGKYADCAPCQAGCR